MHTVTLQVISDGVSRVPSLAADSGFVDRPARRQGGLRSSDSKGCRTIFHRDWVR